MTVEEQGSMKLCAWPGNEALCASLARALGAATFVLETRHFPPMAKVTCALRAIARAKSQSWLRSITRTKTVPLLVLADALRAEGATRVGLIAPYLAYCGRTASWNQTERP